MYITCKNCNDFMGPSDLAHQCTLPLGEMYLVTEEWSKQYFDYHDWYNKGIQIFLTC